MRFSSTSHCLAVLLVVLSPLDLLAQEKTSGQVDFHPIQVPRVEAPDYARAEAGAVQALADTLVDFRTNSSANALFMLPVRGVPDNDFLISGYMDRDETQNIEDYMGGPHTYDGHAGVDFSLPTFPYMDRGVPIFAPADGVVGNMAYHHPDRNSEWNLEMSNLVNGVVMVHDENSVSALLHFRRNSVAVEIGEEIKAGQFLGYVGSSGLSVHPHLHFEVRQSVGEDQVRFVDPFSGPDDTELSLWLDEPRYVGDDPMKVYDVGVSTKDVLEAHGGAPSWADMLEGLEEPAIFGAEDEELFVLWFVNQNPANARYVAEFTAPDGTVVQTAPATIESRWAHAIWYWNWRVGQDLVFEPHGTWTIRMLGQNESGELVREMYSRTIEIGGQTIWRPRFQVGGKSIRINGEVQRDTLRLSSFSGEVTLHLLDQPSFVRLEQDSILVFESTSDQLSRSAHFQVVSTNQHALTDTMWYHVVDPSKPLDAIETSADVSVDVPRSLGMTHNFPNPFRGTTSISYELSNPGPVRIQVFDVLGRAVATLIDGPSAAGRHTVTWDAEGVPGGLYLYRIIQGTATSTGRMVLVR